MNRTQPRRWLTAAAAGAGAAAVAWWAAAPVAVSAGPAIDVWAATGLAAPGEGGPLWAPTVTVTAPAGLVTAPRCALRADCVVVFRPAAQPEPAGAYQAARAAASSLSGTAVADVEAPYGVRGSSASLAYGIALSAAATGTATPPVAVAATGVLNADGSVDPVAGLDMKAVSAQRAGAVVLVAPQAADGAVATVAVSSLADAWTVLCRYGAQGPLCSSSPGADPARSAP